MNTNTQNYRGTLASLRAVRPSRPLDAEEARHVVDRQAEQLRRQLTAGTLTLDSLDQLPRIRLVFDSHMPVSGSSHWNGSEWIITLKADEPAARQRFTAFHELHHIIEHPYRRLTGSVQAELLADQFAASVLMPRRAVTRAWCTGQQRIAQLAARFQVSEPAMRVRLIKLGLLDGSRHDCRRSGPRLTPTGGSR